jgi:hypothetical protein
VYTGTVQGLTFPEGTLGPLMLARVDTVGMLYKLLRANACRASCRVDAPLQISKTATVTVERPRPSWPKPTGFQCDVAEL